MPFKFPLKFHIQAEVDTSLERIPVKMGRSCCIVFGLSMFALNKTHKMIFVCLVDHFQKYLKKMRKMCFLEKFIKNHS